MAISGTIFGFLDDTILLYTIFPSPIGGLFYTIWDHTIWDDTIFYSFTILPIGSMVLAANMTGVYWWDLLPYIPAPWILWVTVYDISQSFDCFHPNHIGSWFSLGKMPHVCICRVSHDATRRQVACALLSGWVGILLPFGRNSEWSISWFIYRVMWVKQCYKPPIWEWFIPSSYGDDWGMDHHCLPTWYTCIPAMASLVPKDSMVHIFFCKMVHQRMNIPEAKPQTLSTPIVTLKP